MPAKQKDVGMSPAHDQKFFVQVFVFFSNFVPHAGTVEENT